MIKEFQYKDKNRSLYVLPSAGAKLVGIEITAMPGEEAEAFLKLVEDYRKAFEPYFKSYYRQFDPEKVLPLR